MSLLRAARRDGQIAGVGEAVSRLARLGVSRSGAL